MTGEIAEMMLEGILCQGCGEFIGDYDGEGLGFPGFCAGCQPDNDGPELLVGMTERKPIGCPDCKRRFKTHAASIQHWRDKHDKTKHKP